MKNRRKPKRQEQLYIILSSAVAAKSEYWKASNHWYGQFRYCARTFKKRYGKLYIHACKQRHSKILCEIMKKTFVHLSWISGYPQKRYRNSVLRVVQTKLSKVLNNWGILSLFDKNQVLHKNTWFLFFI